MPIRPRTANTCIRRCVSSYHRSSWTAGEPSGNAPQLHILLASIANTRVAEGVSVTTREDIRELATCMSCHMKADRPGTKACLCQDDSKRRGMCTIQWTHGPIHVNVPSAAVCCSPLLVIVLVLHVHARRLVPA
jgi:hypothetical protein